MSEEEIIRRLKELNDKPSEDITVEDLIEEAQRRELDMAELVLMVKKYLQS